jgi:VWFA-related protein
MRYVKILAVTLFLAAAVFAQVAPPAGKGSAQDQTARVQGVTVLIAATDAKGIPIRDLTKVQVSVVDGNQPTETLTVLDASDLPLDLGIVLLASKDKYAQEQEAAIDLAQKILRPGKDKAFVVSAAGDKPWTNPNIPWLTDPSAVADSIRGLDKNTGLPDLFDFKLATDAVGVERHSIQTYNLGTGFSVFDVIWAMMKNDPRPARRAVVIFRMASAHSPGFGDKVTRATEEAHNRVIMNAQAMGVAFYAVGIDDSLRSSDLTRNKLGTDYMPTHSGGDDGDARAYDQKMARDMDMQYTAGRNNVDRIADETGGRSYWATKKNYSDAVVGISGEISSRYMVSFVPADKSAAGGVHPIKVQVAGAAHVSAPRAYLVLPPSS